MPTLLAMHIKQTHNAITQPNLLKEHVFPSHGQTEENKARKPNNGSYAICLPQAQHRHTAHSLAVTAKHDRKHCGE